MRRGAEAGHRLVLQLRSRRHDRPPALRNRRVVERRIAAEEPIGRVARRLLERRLLHGLERGRVLAHAAHSEVRAARRVASRRRAPQIAVGVDKVSVRRRAAARVGHRVGELDCRARALACVRAVRDDHLARLVRDLDRAVVPPPCVPPLLRRLRLLLQLCVRKLLGTGDNDLRARMELRVFGWRVRLHFHVLRVAENNAVNLVSRHRLLGSSRRRLRLYVLRAAVE
eukprot:7387826-Prymnesium_polylepis.2